MSSEPPKKTARREATAGGEASASHSKVTFTSLKDGPFSLLDLAQKNSKQIFIRCRNDKCLLGQLRAFDKHFNLLLQGVTEFTSDDTKQRQFNSLFLRGDSVIFIAPMADE
jgi:small nuclear ribonucleoprotein D2